jgi:hypothetical protein
MSTPFMGVFTIGQTIDRGIKLYKLSIGKLFILLIIPNFLLMSPQLMGSSLNSLVSTQSGNATGMLGSLGILWLVSGILYAWAYIVMFRYLYRLTTDQPIASFGQLIRLAKLKDAKYIITGIIWMVTIMVAFMLLLIPGIYLANLMYLLAAPICIVEGHYFFSGIGRMIRLGKGRWWKTFVINLVTFIIMIVPIGASYAFFMWAIVHGMTAFDGAATTEAMTKGGFSLIGLVALLVYAAICALINPLYSAVGIIHFNSLRSEKESSDLAAQLDSLSSEKK